MAENSAAGAVPPKAQAGDVGKGLADYGYSREGYIDQTGLSDFLSREVVAPPTAGSPVNDKIAQYAVDRINTRNTKVESNIATYLANPDSNVNTVNLYKDLYDSYLATNPENPLSRGTFIRKTSNLTSKLNYEKSGKALDTLAGDWSSDPVSFMDAFDKSGVEFGNDLSHQQWASSEVVGKMLGWDAANYDTAYNATGLEDFAGMSRTLKKREEDNLDKTIKALEDAGYTTSAMTRGAIREYATKGLDKGPNPGDGNKGVFDLSSVDFDLSWGDVGSGVATVASYLTGLGPLASFGLSLAGRAIGSQFDDDASDSSRESGGYSKNTTGVGYAGGSSFGSYDSSKTSGGIGYA